MSKTYEIAISFRDFDKLSDTGNLVSAPQQLQYFFAQQGARSNEAAKVIPSPQGKHRHYVLFRGSSGLNIFTLELEVNLHAGSRGEATLKIEDLTPTKSNNINDYAIFQTGIPLFKDGIASYIDGRERERLSGNQLKKWDYFFRASRPALLYWHRVLVGEFKQNIEGYNQKLSSNGIWAGLMLIGAIVLFFSIWKVVAIAISAYIFYRYRSIFINIFQAIIAVNEFKSAIITLEEEALYLGQQLDQQPATDAQIREWLDNEIKALDSRAWKELKLDPERIAGLSPGLKSRDTVGLNIEEWGMIQSVEANGKNTINKPQHFFHQLGVRINQGRHIYAVYYINLLYMTEQGLGVYGCFYDFILEKVIGTVTNFYYYKDIVSIGSKVVDSKVLDDSYELETKQTIITFYNNERIVITLTDGTTLKSLGEQIEAQKRLENMDYQDPLLLDSPEYEQLIELADDNPVATRSNAILTSVKEFWNQHKSYGGTGTHLD